MDGVGTGMPLLSTSVAEGTAVRMRVLTFGRPVQGVTFSERKVGSKAALTWRSGTWRGQSAAWQGKPVGKAPA